VSASLSMASVQAVSAAPFAGQPSFTNEVAWRTTVVGAALRRRVDGVAMPCPGC
jgi:hypothetical protein